MDESEPLSHASLLKGARVVVTRSVAALDERGRPVCYVHPSTLRALARRYGLVEDPISTVLSDRNDSAEQCAAQAPLSPARRAV